ncbi:MAG: hypothetical protein V3V95_07930 [Thermodesulfobacteriota bacterium]
MMTPNDTSEEGYRDGDFFSGIWNGEKTRALRKAVLDDDTGFNPCGSCYYKHDMH